LRHQQQAMIKQSSEDVTAASSTVKKSLAPTSSVAEEPAKKNLASTEKSTTKRSAKAKDKNPSNDTPVAPILAEKKRKQGKQFNHYYNIFNFVKLNVYIL
jgi:hypothetical protein